MQENKLISTIESLNSLGQTKAIAALAKDLKEAYDFAVRILGVEDDSVKPEIKKTPETDEKKPLLNTFESKFYDYSSKWNPKQKLQYILKVEKRFLHFREIAKIILKLEGKEASYDNQRELARKLSSNTGIRNLKKNNLIVSIKHGISLKSTFWGSKKWVDSNGKIIPGYEYNTEILNEGRKEVVAGDNSLFDI